MSKQKSGAIVNTASISGIQADYGVAAYNTIKAGLINLTRAFALEYGPAGIRANCVCPGVINTPLLGGAGDDPEMRKRIESRIPLRRLGRPEDIANVVLFLASDLAAFVTGSAYVADGGQTAHTGIPPNHCDRRLMQTPDVALSGAPQVSRKQLVDNSQPGRTALDDLKIVELPALDPIPFFAASMAGRAMADLGAEVIKIEPPNSGARERHCGPSAGTALNPETRALHLFLDCNKLGATLDLEHPRGPELLMQILAGADAVFNPNPPALNQRLGLGWRTLCERFPRLVVVSTTSSAPIRCIATCAAAIWSRPR